uniref:uncharacterized protein isoform X2 n=1 Tax=Myxine glutinosa TaxID=7769 RepID=UPI00358EDAD0
MNKWSPERAIMLSWIVLFLSVPTSQADMSSIKASPGENVTINSGFAVHPDESSLISIWWKWKPVDEVAEIEIFLHHGISDIIPNTRFSNRLIVTGNINVGVASLLINNVTSLDSGILTCEHRLTARVISQTSLSVRLLEEQETKICPTGLQVKVTFIRMFNKR